MQIRWAALADLEDAVNEVGGYTLLSPCRCNNGSEARRDEDHLVVGTKRLVDELGVIRIQDTQSHWHL